MATDKTTDVWKELRKPFPKESIGKLPKGGVMLDYVGHASVTDRLLEVDPQWTWEPLGTREDGLPATDNAGNLWIKLTVNGVTRIGVGDGKNAKECISDAIRNAAMRFGVALDLWSKEELESHVEAPELKNEKPLAAAPKPAVGSAPAMEDIPVVPDTPPARRRVSEAQVKLLLARSRDASGLNDRQDIYDWFLDKVGCMPNEVHMDEVDDVLKVIGETS